MIKQYQKIWMQKRAVIIVDLIFFFRFASSLVHSFHSLIIVSFGSDLNLRIMFVIWAITVDKKTITYAQWLPNLITMLYLEPDI